MSQVHKNSIFGEILPSMLTNFLDAHRNTSTDKPENIMSTARNSDANIKTKKH